MSDELAHPTPPQGSGETPIQALRDAAFKHSLAATHALAELESDLRLQSDANEILTRNLEELTAASAQSAVGNEPGNALPQDVQEWIWHMDLHLTEHDERHAGLALRAAWPPVKDWIARLRGDYIALRNHNASAQSAAGAEADIERQTEWLTERLAWLKKEAHSGGDFDHLNTRREECAYIMGALKQFARPAPPAVPEGWRLVPETLITRPMIEAGINSQETTKAEDPDGAISVCATWEAMLSAAPRAKEGA